MKSHQCRKNHFLSVVQTFTWYAYRVTCLQRGVDLDRLKLISPPLDPPPLLCPPPTSPPLTSTPPSLMSCCSSSLNNDDAGYSKNTHHARKVSSGTRLMPLTARFNRKWSLWANAVTHLDSYGHASSSSMYRRLNASSVRHEKCSRSIRLYSMILRDSWRRLKHCLLHW